MNSESIQINRKGFVKTIGNHWKTLLLLIVPVGTTTVPVGTVIVHLGTTTVPVGTVTVPVGTMTVPTETMLNQFKIHSNLIEFSSKSDENAPNPYQSSPQSIED